MTWPLDVTVYLGLVALFLGHAWLAGTVSDAQRKHSLYFGLGLATLWLALETPIDTISDRYLESVHMLQHVLLGFVAPPLLLLGLSPQMVGRLVRVPGTRAITEPVPAQLIAGLVMVTDGADTSDASLDESLASLKARSIPVFTVGVGQERFTRDVQITRVETPRVVLKGTSLVVDGGQVLGPVTA